MDNIQTVPVAVNLNGEDYIKASDLQEVKQTSFSAGRAHQEVISRGNHREAIIEVMRGEADNTMTNQDATELANKLLVACGMETVETLNRKYRVTVSYEGNELVAFNDVLAEDEEAACKQVEDEMYYDETHEVRVQFEFDGTTREGEISFTVDSNEFEFDAEEQE